MEAPVQSRNPFELFETRTNLVDSGVISAAEEYLQPKLAADFVVTAVGGYGRRELFPYSDIDLLLLFENDSDLVNIKEPLSEFFRILWDSGFRVSHSVRTVAECCRLQEQNTELHISLLDVRFLYGDEELFGKLSQRLPEFYQRSADAIKRPLAELAGQRHAKFNHTVYHLEPNVKEAPGGIRDIHLVHWLLQLTPQQEAIREAAGQLADARRFLYSVRCFLHLQTGRDNNLLSFELQDQAAEVLPEHSLAPEEWMRIYYRHARQAYQAALRALEYMDDRDISLARQFRDWRSRLSTSEFTISRERVLLRNPNLTLSSPVSALWLFVFLARHGVRLAWDTQRRLCAKANSFAELFQKEPLSWPLWEEFLSQPHAAMALREMQETDFLPATIPEWQSVDSLVVRDFYHRYTVDEHTFVAIETIDKLSTDKAPAVSRFRELLEEEDQPAVLRLALLLHDFGKGTTPGDHVRGSLETARLVMDRLHVPEEKQNTVLFLIEHHLDLSLIMNGRDLNDPSTARFLTSRVGTQENLRRLALLTYADINAVNPTALTPWRVEQLWRVYSMGLEQLTRELATDRIHGVPTFTSGDPVSPELAHFLEGLPTRYLRTHTRPEIERHFALEQKSRRDGVAVEIQPEPGAYRLTVLAGDQPGLFSRLCGSLASFGMNIVKAEACSNAGGRILDLLRFTDPIRTLELNPGEISRLEWTIECVVRGSIQVSDLLKRRRAAPLPNSRARIAPVAHFNNEASETSTLIEFAGEDRPGLLYDLTSTLSAAGCNIEVVMIDTEGHKALDVFYVTRNGNKLDDTIQQRLGAELVRAADKVSVAQ